MIPADEVVATRILPTVRAMVAKSLQDRGLTERGIAERLGLTQSAVSKYLRGRVRLEPLVQESPTFRALVDGLAAALAEDRVSNVEVLGRILEAVRKEEDRGVVCRLHEREMPSLAGIGCDLCVRAGTSDLRQEQEVLADLRAALRDLQSLEGFDALIPSVGSNLARAKRDARTPDDVAAVPGRIFVMRGALRVPAAPEFGASKHVAEVVLAAQRGRGSVAAALNIRWNRALGAAARKLDWDLLEFDASLEGDAERIAQVLTRHRRAPEMLYQAGAFGTEPIAYLLAPTAMEAVGRARALLGALKGRGP